MLKQLIIFLIVFPLALNAQVYESPWQTQTIKIDGDLSDWDERPGHYDSKSSVLFGYRNDSTNLYLAFEIPNRMMQMKIINAGFKVELAVKVKPKVNATISFPIQQRSDDNMEKGNKPDIQKIQQNYKLLNSPALVEGFKLSKGSILPGNASPNSLTYAVDWDSYEAMIFEICVPLTELFKESNAFETIAKTELVIHSTFAAMERPSNSQGQHAGMQMQGGGGGHGGKGGRSGGGMGGQRPNKSSDSQQSTMQDDMLLMSTEQSFKNKFHLSTSK